jgi:Zn-dependent peptidase ImmA (M78 family)
MNTEPCALSYDAIREYAERVGSKHEIYEDEGHADIDGLVERLGGQVTRGERHELVVYQQGEFIISVHDFQSDRRSRFDKAHALGHYFLHYLYVGHESHRMFDRTSRGDAETQANVFAATLMLPESQFRNAFETTGDDYWALSRVFEVSPASAKTRAQLLGLAD